MSREFSTGQRLAYPKPSSAAVTTIMKANRSRNTSPELKIRSILHRSGLRYRVHFPVRIDDRRPINVDIAFPRLRIAVFVDGCFWHGCREHRTVPIANNLYWSAKLAGNVARDQETVDRLSRHGWAVMRVWEHENAAEAAARIYKFVRATQTAKSIHGLKSS